MTVRELYEILSEYVESDPDAEVRFASQPRWAFEYEIDGAEEVFGDDGDLTLYLAEGRQIGYLPQNAADRLGW